MPLRLALVQLKVENEKTKNLSKAVSYIQKAKQQGADLVILPEFFSCVYVMSAVPEHAELIPTGETCKVLSQAARQNEIYIIGGSFPEKDGDKLYNTSTVWGPNGELIAKHRKVHLFNIYLPEIVFQESEVFTGGETLTTFKIKDYQIGLGLCHDIKFEEMARLYRNMGCDLLVYPAAFNLTTGSLYWTLLQRARATDNQLYVTCVSPSRNLEADYVAYGHTQLIDPWGKVVHEMDEHEDMFVGDIDLELIKKIRTHLPIFDQRRLDVYDTIYKKDNIQVKSNSANRNV